jgi:hypothetical protein
MKAKETTKKKKRLKKRKVLFVVKLFQFLMSDDQHVDIVSWYKDCFVVWDHVCNVCVCVLHECTIVNRHYYYYYYY